MLFSYISLLPDPATSYGVTCATSRRHRERSSLWALRINFSDRSVYWEANSAFHTNLSFSLWAAKSEAWLQGESASSVGFPIFAQNPLTRLLICYSKWVIDMPTVLGLALAMYSLTHLVLHLRVHDSDEWHEIAQRVDGLRTCRDQFQDESDCGDRLGPYGESHLTKEQAHFDRSNRPAPLHQATYRVADYCVCVPRALGSIHIALTITNGTYTYVHATA